MSCRDNVKQTCVFQSFLSTCIGSKVVKANPLGEITTERITKVIECSNAREDNLASTIIPEVRYHGHKDCLSTYVSKCHILRHIERKRKLKLQKEPTPPKKPRRESFPIKENCLMCGEICQMQPDPKNPKRHKRKVCEARTADRGKGKKSFEEVLLMVSNS